MIQSLNQHRRFRRRHAILCCVVLCYVMLCYIVLCYVVLFYVVLFYVVLCKVRGIWAFL